MIADIRLMQAISIHAPCVRGDQLFADFYFNAK